MARGRQQQDDRARRFAVALASFVRAQAGMPLQAVGESAECLRLVSGITDLLGQGRPSGAARRLAGRRPVHDRAFAKATLLDFVTQDPDGMAHQAALIRELERRFQASGHPVPGETWLKQTVREFQVEAHAFEADAAATFQASPTLQGIFADLGDFLRFRRAKARVAQMWRHDSELRARFASPEMLFEAAIHKGFSAPSALANRAHSRLPVHRETVSNAGIKRR